MKEIRLTTKEELSIFMSPQRQQLMRTISIAGRAMTAKTIADALAISASSVQHHLRKLIKIGLVEQDHTEVINGITAVFYKPSDVTVHIGHERQDELSNERNILMQKMISQVYSGYLRSLEQAKKLKFPETELKQYGDVLTGVVHLSPKDSQKLLQIISNFLEAHGKADAGTEAWEYALVAYNTKLDSGTML